MAAMKVTISAAMRARDVSRPHAEHLADAEAAEADAVRGGPRRPPFLLLPFRHPWLLRPGSGACGSGACGWGGSGGSG